MELNVNNFSPAEVRRGIEDLQTQINDSHRVVNTAVGNATDENKRLLTENDELRKLVRELRGEIREQEKILNV
jgi:regulator of replication initiation timing